MEKISYTIPKENLDFPIIKKLINVFKTKEVWLSFDSISKDEVKKIKTDKIFINEDKFYMKLKKNQFYYVISQILELNYNFCLFSLKKEYNSVTKEMLNDKEILYKINFDNSKGKLNINFDLEKFNKITTQVKLDNIIKEINTRDKQRKQISNGMVILFIVTVLTFFIAGNIISEISINTEYMWSMWLWLPIPILSIILGYKYQKMKVKCKKNIIGGYIVAFMLLLFGFYTFIFPNENYQEIFKLEGIINVPLPNDGIYMITKWNDKALKCNTLHDVYFKEHEELEREIENSKTWVKSNSFNSNVETLISPLITCSDEENCYYSVYIKETNLYNTLPTENGLYHIYTMVYNQDIHRLKIVEYNYSYDV